MTVVDRTRTSLQRRTVLAMALCAVGLAVEARAQPADLVDLTVVDRETGEPLRVWRHRGRLFVAGQPGARYSLRVSNRTGGRLLIVMSVDGVNILTGETAAYGQGGYVFDPYETYDVSGWRKSNSEVAAFSFASLRESYAARTGRPDDVGVIGLAVFRERAIAPRTISRAPTAKPRAQARDSAASSLGDTVVTSRRSAPAQAGEAAAAPPRARLEEKLGTAHGAREWSQVRVVSFERATAYPQMIRRIEYDTRDNLVAAGVIRPYQAERRPRPFPGDQGGYVPDPPDWP